MIADYWGAVAIATGMWIIASAAVISSDAKSIRSDGVIWTATSSDKVTSHPTLVRRSLPAASGVRTAALGQSL
jgi:hypothetical protein